VKLKTVLALAALCVPLTSFALSDDDIEHEPLLARTAHNYENSCAWQSKVVGILALAIKENNEKYLDFAASKFVQFNFRSGSFLRTTIQLQNDPELLDMMAEWGKPSAGMDNTPSLKQTVEVCSTNPRRYLMNFYTGFYGPY
jgi:hypothetical protein